MIKKDAIPVITPSSDYSFHCPITHQEVKWMDQNVYNPVAIERDGLLHLFFRADSLFVNDIDDCGNRMMTCRIGHAVSNDGIHFNINNQPVLYPDRDAFLKFEWWGGCQDLHIIEGPDHRYYMNYDAWTGLYDGKYEYGHDEGALQDVLLCAVSDDLEHWSKTGPAFDEDHMRFWNHSRSGTVLCEEDRNHHFVAKKIDGLYWMYMSHRGYLAFSADLVHWKPALGENGEIISLFNEYPKLQYCTNSCEAGAGAIFTEQGIHYFFNAMGYTSPTVHEWCLGKALIDSTDLKTIKSVQPSPFLKPEFSWEKSGHCGCPATVCNTIIYYAGAWRIYYGAADHVIGMAILDDYYMSGE